MKRTPGTTAAEKEQYWTFHIEQARRHPKSVAAYCRENGLNQNTYYYWYVRLHEKHPDWNDLSQDPLHYAKRAKSKKEKESPTPPTEVEPNVRRTFTAKQKARILSETDGAEPGQVAAILRREGLYSSTLQKWRKQREEKALAPKKRGPQADVQATKIKSLEAKVAQLEKKLKHKDMLLDLQKKITQIMERTVDQQN